MYQALNYLLSRWETFIGFTTRGDLPIDPQGVWPLSRQAQPSSRARHPSNGHRQEELVPKGSEDATDWAATNFTIFESCRLAKVNPRA